MRTPTPTGGSRGTRNIQSQAQALAAPEDPTPPTESLWKLLGVYNNNGQAPDGEPVAVTIITDTTGLPPQVVYAGPGEFGVSGTGALVALTGGSMNCELNAGQYDPSGAGTWPGIKGGGVLRWRITSGGAQREFLSDLRPGRYHCGVCDQVRVDVLRWNVGAYDPLDATLYVTAAFAIEPGGGSYDEWTFTCERAWVEGGTQPTGVYIPRRARWWVPLYGALGTGVFWGTYPDALFNDGGNGGIEQVVYSPVNYLVAPSKHRYELAGDLAAGVLSITGGASPMVIGARFYLAR